MARKVKEFVQIDKLSSLDALIDALNAVRQALPAEAEPEVLLRGCDVFGRHVAVSYMRPQTQDEADVDARYAEVCAQMMQRQETSKTSRHGRLRAVA